MANFIYPSRDDLRIFISIIQKGNYRIKKYLPHTDEEWYRIIGECVEYVHNTSRYEENKSFHDTCARFLYKIAKRHELGDGNKRSSVMCVFIFCVLNDYIIIDPAILKKQAKRIASTHGRDNEELIKNRVAQDLTRIIISTEQAEGTSQLD